MPTAPKPKSPAGKPVVKPRAAGVAQKAAAGRAAQAAPDSVATVIAEAPVAPGKAGGKAAPGLRLRELVDAIALRTGAKKAEVKPIAEAALAVLGEALARGEGFTLPGLGKAKVAKSKAVGGGEVLTLKLKRSAEKNADTPLAEADD